MGGWQEENENAQAFVVICFGILSEMSKCFLRVLGWFEYLLSLLFVFYEFIKYMEIFGSLRNNSKFAT